MTVLPKQLSEKFIPGLGEQHEVGASGLGVSVITATLGCNTALTDAELIAAPPNTATHDAHGPLVHSLGVAPTLCVIEHRITGGDVTGLVNGVTFAFMTANASAMFYRARSFTGTAPAGVAVRASAIR